MSESELENIKQLNEELKLKIKKLWLMNEKVYQEKKKTDDINSNLIEELGALEGENSKYKSKTTKLWAQSVAIHKEKERIDSLKKELEYRNKEILDSINYAERIQRSFLATKDILDENLKDYFVIFKPKDVVSGDFYWATTLINNDFAFSIADSTGHGVPGAIMSILNISSLEKSSHKETEPNIILNKTRDIIIDRLKKDGSDEGGKDGMDCTLLVLNPEKTKLKIAASQNHVWIIRNGDLLEFKGDKMPVGKHDRDSESFITKEVDILKNDVIYSTTDGFPDQFGGPKGKKFMSKKLKKLLIEISPKSMFEQEEILSQTFSDWKGELEQVDDVCLMGIRI